MDLWNKIKVGDESVSENLLNELIWVYLTFSTTKSINRANNHNSYSEETCFGPLKLLERVVMNHSMYLLSPLSLYAFDRVVVNTPYVLYS